MHLKRIQIKTKGHIDFRINFNNDIKEKNNN